MKRSHTFTIAVLTMLVLQSCIYTWTRVQSTAGEKYYVRKYRNSEKQQQYEDKLIFKYWKKEKSYEKYSGLLFSDTTHGSTFIQFDSVRVYLFQGTAEFKIIFTTGLVSAQLLYCKIDSSCKIPEEARITHVDTGEPLNQNLWGWSGPTITIEHFEEIKYIKSKPTQRKFKFWVNPYKTRLNGGNDIFLLELTNETANEQTDIETFARGATVTFLTKARTMI